MLPIPRDLALPAVAIGRIGLLVIALATTSVAVRADVSSTPACRVDTAVGVSLAIARTEFQARCNGFVRRDCDPLPGGGWACSSDVIGDDAPPAPDDVMDSYVDATDVADLGGVCLSPVAPSLGLAQAAFRNSCKDFMRRDCDPVSKGWRCSSGIIGNRAPAVSGDSLQVALPEGPGGPGGSPPEVQLQTSSDTASTPVTPVQGTDLDDPAPVPQSPASAQGGATGRIAVEDLVVLHYDNCPDKDDGHALAAGHTVVQSVGLQRVLVVNGTCGHGIESAFNPASRAVVAAVWGDSALDAIADPGGSVTRAADAWAAVLGNGASVWVAEGGPADFTARVLRLIEQRNPSLDLKRVHVVQHSAGNAFNERKSIYIAFVKRTADYIAIGNGNASNNGTANLRQQSSDFIARALSSQYANEWRAAFDFLPPGCELRTEQCKLDFSDTVELLYLIGDESTTGVDDFARRYFD